MSVTARTLKNGKTVFDVRVQYGGLRVSRTVPSTRTEAKRVESRILQDLIRGKFDILQKTTNPKFKDYADEYKKSITWQKSYGRTITSLNHLVKCFGDKRLTDITTQQFLEYRTRRLGDGVAVATINREHACLLRMLNIAVESEDFLLHKNPLKPVKFFKEKPTEDRIITREEYYRLLEAAPEYFRRIVFFACNTAMRLMEILNLQFKQVKIWFSGAEIELIDTKSGDKEFVSLNGEVVDLLQQIASERKIDLYHLSEDDKNQYVFTGARGQRLKSVRKPMLKTFKQA
ncbi:tyrosine-type recombinase/integrase, partial [candidate division KSB1 bacterium]|nr:tyrosine-type recombinase/integrase [candidate division KSB1 bacterium]